MAESDAAFGQVVGGKFQCDPVACEYANAVTPQAPSQVRQDHSVMLKLHTEEPTWKFFQNDSRNFNIVFLTHPILSQT